MTLIQESIQRHMANLPQLGGSALVEAGHIYAGETPSSEHELGLEVGVAAIEALQDFGMQVSAMLFIDDYNGKGSVDETLTAYQHVIEFSGFRPQIIVGEASLAGDVSDLICTLQDKGRIVEKKQHISFKNGSDGLVRLATFDGAGLTRRYYCVALDASLYLKKAEMIGGGLLVTVLPESYREEQEKTKKLVRAAGLTAPILNIYFSQVGRIDVDFDY